MAVVTTWGGAEFFAMICLTMCALKRLNPMSAPSRTPAETNTITNRRLITLLTARST